MLLRGFCSLFVLLLWEFKPAAGATTNVKVDVPSSPPSDSETLVPTLLSFSLEQDRWPGSFRCSCTLLALTVA